MKVRKLMYEEFTVKYLFNILELRLLWIFPNIFLQVKISPHPVSSVLLLLGGEGDTCDFKDQTTLLV